MKMHSIVLIALIGGGQIPMAQGAMIVNDNFDSYASQAAFEAVWVPIGSTAPISGALSTAQAASSPNSVQNPATATNSQSRNQATFAETSTLSSSGNLGIGDTLTWSLDYFDSSPTTSPQRNYANLQDTTAPSGTNQLIALGLNNNQSGANSGGQYYMARILGYTVPTTADPDGGPAESVGGSGVFFKLNDFGVGLRSLGWHNLKVVLSTNDGLSTDYAFYVDNQLAERVNDVGTAASIRSYDNIRLGSGLSNGNTEVFFDNVQLDYAAAVPEPGIAVLLAVASWGMFASRRRIG